MSVSVARISRRLFSAFPLKPLDRNWRGCAGLAAAEGSRQESDSPVIPKTSQKVKASKSFAMNMFRGQVEVEQVFPFPQVLDGEGVDTLMMLVEATEKFFTEVNNAAKNDEMADFDPKVVASLKELGAFGLQVPTQYGGLGLTNTQCTRLVEIVGANDLAVATMMGAHQSIGFKGILLYGTPEQKQKYLPDLASGKRIAAFCLTEPASGSDASSIRSRAELSPDGKHYILNGSKLWISNGGIADVFTVFAKTPVKSSDGTKKEKISAFFVERSFGGVTSGPPEGKMGIKASNTAEVYFDNVKVPVDCLIGKEGEGFKVAMNILNNGRFGIAAAMSGTMKYCIKKAIDHANVRTQFGQRLVEFGGIREKIAAMTLLHYATESMAYMISGNMDQGSSEFQLEAAMSKIYSSEAAWFVCDEAIQILGGMGYMKECGLEKVMRDLRIVRIYEGTNDILRLFIALVGIEYAGGHLKQLEKAMKNPLASYGVIRDEVIRRAKRMAKMTTQKNLIVTNHPDFEEHAKSLTDLIEMFGASVETLLFKHGKTIVDKQYILTPLADAATQIYAMAVVISRAMHSLQLNRPTANYEKNLCQLFCRKTVDSVSQTIAKVRSPKEAVDFNLASDIAEAVSISAEVVQKTPLNI
uniref:Very long-chain specific acyl-CoA dehydrogenase, mitochondrial n=1 Tax=Trichuris muris TaxID=70415 RepID=A0A5S6Q3M2_TRIMR